MQYRNVLNESLALDLEEAGRVSVLREEVVTQSPVARQANELAVAVLFRLCRGVLGETWLPQSVHFTHEAPADSREHRRFFRCKLVFDSEFNGIVCRTTDWTLPTRSPTRRWPTTRHASWRAAGGARRSVAADVRRCIYLLLPLGRATIVQIAESLGMNVRTLQRRLSESGLAFGSWSLKFAANWRRATLATPAIPWPG
jgi:hypothetical protein